MAFHGQLAAGGPPWHVDWLGLEIQHHPTEGPRHNLPLGQRRLIGAKTVGDPYDLRMGHGLAVFPGHRQLIDAAHADDARIAVVEFPGLPPCPTEGLGEPVGIVSRLDQPAFLRDVPHLGILPATSPESRHEAIDVD